MGRKRLYHTSEEQQEADRRWSRNQKVKNPNVWKGCSKRYRERHPDKIRNADLKRKYKITLEEYNSKFLEQGGVCAICGKPETWIVRGTLASLSVDHNHKTKQNRGLLCRNCNCGLGQFNEDITKLLNAVQYLRKWKNED